VKNLPVGSQKTLTVKNEAHFMNRRALLIAVAAGASGLAGCQSKSGCPPTLHVDESTESETTATREEAIPYQELSEKRQQEFMKSLETGGAELDETEGAWVETRYVKYRGDYYVTGVAVC
jgi:N-acetylmuramic acid 6-phosphate (MurNAc-6-P) etherase